MLLRAIHIILLASVLFSSTGLVVNSHFCQGSLKSLALFLEPANCHSLAQQDMPPSCPMHAAKQEGCEEEEDKNCCNNQSDYVQSDQDKQVETFEYKEFEEKTLAWTSLRLQNEGLPSLISFDPYRTYRPPPLHRDFPATLQTFLL